MHYQKPSVDKDLPQDDIDKLFSQLQTIEPPPAFVSSLLSQVSASALPGSLFPQFVVWNSLDRWAMRNRKRQLC
jgi:hypothetical protein